MELIVIEVLLAFACFSIKNVKKLSAFLHKLNQIYKKCKSLWCSLKTWSWYFVDLIDMGKLHEIHNSHCVKIFRIRKLSVFLLVRILPHSDRIWRDTPYLSVLSPNAGKYRLENSEYEHFSHSEWFIIIIMTISKKFKEI